MEEFVKNGFDFRAWFEMQMQDNEITHQQLAEKLDVTATHKLIRLLNGSDSWTAKQAKTVAEAFHLHWWDDFVQPLRMYGLKTSITLDEADNLLRKQGERIDRVTMVA